MSNRAARRSAAVVAAAVMGLGGSGHRWATRLGDETGGDALSALNGVSCSSSRACIAVGGEQSVGAQESIIKRWDARNWSRAATQPLGAIPRAISCPSARACTAVGAAGIVIRWDGRRWSRHRSGPDVDFSDVSCHSLWTCVAVGTSSDGASSLSARDDARAGGPSHPPRTLVSVFPLPGTRYSRPQTQISFRGVSAREIGRVRVVGSRSGVHRGRLEADSDRGGASFVPAKPFAAGETVAVTTRLNLVGARDGRFRFGIADVAPLIPAGRLGGIPPVMRHGVMHFRSAPRLKPPAVHVITNSAPTGEGDIFVAPQNGPLQDGPMILDSQGRLVWFAPYPVANELFVNDFRVQRLYGQPVLTWWQGFREAEFGQSRGVGVILNRRYRRIATVRAGNGLDAGSHEFLVTPQGDAYITASSPVKIRSHRGVTIDSVVQEIDIRTGLVLFDWHALDHIPLDETYAAAASANSAFDPYHVNSISIGTDGNLLVSMRNTSAVYDIDRRSGRVLWTLGGKRSSFRMGPGTETYLQHDAEAQPDGTLTVFDNGGAPPFLHEQSCGIHERLDLHTMTATLIRTYDHSLPLRTAIEGGVQMLPDGGAFIGWGAQPFFSEYSPSGQQVFDARFTEPVASYRAYRLPWNAQPATVPSVAVSRSDSPTRHVFVSWNGATDVSSWRVIAGSRRRRLTAVATAQSTGFETAIAVRTTAAYVAVEALDAGGHVLSRSSVIAVRTDHRA